MARLLHECLDSLVTLEHVLGESPRRAFKVPFAIRNLALPIPNIVFLSRKLRLPIFEIPLLRLERLLLSLET